MNKLFNKIAAGVVGITMAIGVGVAIGSQRNSIKNIKAAEVTYKTVVFTSDTMESVNSYSNSWTCTSEVTLSMENFNNYSLGWSYVKCGRKNNASTAVMTTTAAIDTAISSVVVTVDSYNTSNGTATTTLEVSTSSDFSVNKQTISPSMASGALTYSITTPTANAYYRLTYTCASGKANGFIQISKVEFKRTVAADPAVTIADPTLTKLPVDYAVSTQLTANATDFVGTVTYTWSISSGSSYVDISANAENCTVTSKSSNSSTGTAIIQVSATDGTSTKTATKSISIVSVYDVAGAMSAIDSQSTISGAFVAGKISQIDSYNSTYGSIQYWISDDGTTTTQLEAYSGKGLYGANFTAKTDIEVGADVVIYGNLKKYNTTYEFDMNNYQVSYTAPVITVTHNVTFNVNGGDGTPESPLVVGDGLTFTFPSAGSKTNYIFSGWSSDSGSTFFQPGATSGAVSADIQYVAYWQTEGTSADPYSVADAMDAIDNNKGLIGAHVSGKVSQVDSYNSTYHSITYWISDDGTTTTQLEAFSGKGLSSADFAAVTDVEVGADVVVCGTLKKYNTTYEFDKNNYLVSYTAPTPTPTISVSPATLSLTVGGATGTITPAIENAGSPAPTVVWTTSNANVATVSGGTVSPVGQGTCTITATITVSGTDYSATCTVTVSPAPVVIDASGVYTMVTDDSTLAAGDIVIITRNNGETAMSTTQNGNNRGSVATNFSNDEITISGTTTIQAFVLEEYTVGDYATFAFNTGDGYIYAASSGSNYLRTESTLDDNGKFTVSIDSSDGIATITARGENTRNLIQYNTGSSIFACYGSAQSNGAVSIFKKGAAPVDPTKVTSVTLDSNSATIGAGETVTLTATVSPSTALDKSVSWSTSDPTVATVANGVVTGVGAGTATITVTTTDGNKTATCEVTVRTITLGFFYQVTDASALAANDKVVIAAHVGDNIKVMENVSPDTKKMPAASVDSSAKWTDTFGNQTVKSFRHDAGSTLWTVSGDSTGWTFSNGSTELYANASNTNLYTAASGSTLVLSSGTHGTFRLAISGSTRAVAYQVSGNVFGHYATSNIDGSAYYDVEIYKLVENPTVLTGLTCTGTGSYTGDWSSLTTAFGNLTLGEKAYYKHASYTVSGEGTETVVTATDGTNASVAAFVAKYDYIVAKYGTTSNPDFIGRNPSPLNSGRISFFGSDATNSGPTLAIIIASILSLTAVGGYFVIRKRKFTK